MDITFLKKKAPGKIQLLSNTNAVQQMPSKNCHIKQRDIYDAPTFPALERYCNQKESNSEPVLRNKYTAKFFRGATTYSYIK